MRKYITMPYEDYVRLKGGSKDSLTELLPQHPDATEASGSPTGPPASDLESRPASSAREKTRPASEGAREEKAAEGRRAAPPRSRASGPRSRSRTSSEEEEEEEGEEESPTSPAPSRPGARPTTTKPPTTTSTTVDPIPRLPARSRGSVGGPSTGSLGRAGRRGSRDPSHVERSRRAPVFPLTVEIFQMFHHIRLCRQLVENDLYRSDAYASLCASFFIYMSDALSSHRFDGFYTPVDLNIIEQFGYYLL